MAIWEDGVVWQAGQVGTTPEELRLFADSLAASDEDAGYMVAREVLRSREPPQSSRSATSWRWGLLRAALKEGVSVPENLSVVGHYDVPILRSPPHRPDDRFSRSGRSGGGDADQAGHEGDERQAASRLR
jgi:hypothetical protein